MSQDKPISDADILLAEDFEERRAAMRAVLKVIEHTGTILERLVSDAPLTMLDVFDMLEENAKGREVLLAFADGLRDLPSDPTEN